MRRIITACVLLIAPGVATAQSAVDAASVPRTPWGAPDLQGTWDFRTSTPLERPDHLRDREFLTDEEAVAWEESATERLYARLQADGGDAAYEAGADWGTELAAGNRTSLVVTPAGWQDSSAHGHRPDASGHAHALGVGACR